MQTIYQAMRAFYTCELDVRRAGLTLDEVSPIEVPNGAPRTIWTLDDYGRYFNRDEAEAEFLRFGGELVVWILDAKGMRYAEAMSIVAPWTAEYWAAIPEQDRAASWAMAREAMDEDPAAVPAPARMALTGAP